MSFIWQLLEGNDYIYNHNGIKPTQVPNPFKTFSDFIFVKSGFFHPSSQLNFYLSNNSLVATYSIIAGTA